MKAIIWLVVALALFACAGSSTTPVAGTPSPPVTGAPVTPPPGFWVRVPDTVAHFIGRARRNYDDPAAGVGLRYEHPALALFADIFIYPGPDLATNCPLPCAKTELAREIAEFEAYVPGRMTEGRFAQAGRVTATEALTPPRDAGWQLGHHVAAAITRDGRELRSEFYLFYLPRYRVKFRSTFVHSQARDEALDAFVKAVLAGLPTADRAEP
jgi:hypothetical protein